MLRAGSGRNLQRYATRRVATKSPAVSRARTIVTLFEVCLSRYFLAMRWHAKKLTRNLSAVMIVCVLSFGQSSQTSSPQPPEKASDNADSVAGIARQTKAQKASHAKKVWTDDDIDAVAGPLPRLQMQGPENADEIVAAIALYKKTHTPEQTENAVHSWYTKYDEELAAAIQENLDLASLREANMANGYEMCQQSQDYEYCQKRHNAEARGARDDQSNIKANSIFMVRSQHAFMKIRNGLSQNGLRYDWFKIRTTNNIDTF
jgi:hypothetical protein